MQLTASPVKQAALELGLTVAQPEKLRNNAEALQMLKDTGADVMVVAAVWLNFAAGCVGYAQTRLPQYPRIAVAPLARRGTDSTCD